MESGSPGLPGWGMRSAEPLAAKTLVQQRLVARGPRRLERLEAPEQGEQRGRLERLERAAEPLAGPKDNIPGRRNLSQERSSSPTWLSRGAAQDAA